MLNRALESLIALDGFVRLHQIGFVALWPLLGFASVASWSPRTFIALLAVTFFFNSFGVVLNDVVDLPVDRTAPLRNDSPMVRGTIGRETALLLAIVQIPLMLAAHLLGDLSWHLLPLLLAVTLSLAAYDLWSKTTRIPPAVDAALAVSGFLFVLYGAGVAGVPLTPLVWPTALSSGVFLLFVNAFCNGLRDIENDRSCGRNTTPIWLGCGGLGEAGFQMSASMLAYCALLQLALIVLALVAATQIANVSSETGIRSVGLVLITSLGSGALFVRSLWAGRREWDILMRAHLVVMPLPLMVAFIPRLGVLGSSVLFSTYVLGLTPLVVRGYVRPKIWRLSSARSNVVNQ